MFDKIKMTLLKKILEKVEPGREQNIEKIGNRLFIVRQDTVGVRGYKLKGTYSYNDVIELVKMINRYAVFGVCDELGPIAFMGMANSECLHHNGYFKYKVEEYGSVYDDSEYYFEYLDDTIAKGMGGFTVYGMSNPRMLNGAVPIDKLNAFYDYRYYRKDESSTNEIFKRDVLEMDMKLKGEYSFKEAQKMAYGTYKKPDAYHTGQVPLQFAIVGDNQPVGIMNMQKHHDNAKFRDVWEFGKEEPESLPMKFISSDEASKISNFKLYYFNPVRLANTQIYPIEKFDRMLDERFDFMMEDGKDFRLKEYRKTR